MICPVHHREDSCVTVRLCVSCFDAIKQEFEANNRNVMVNVVCDDCVKLKAEIGRLEQLLLEEVQRRKALETELESVKAENAKLAAALATANEKTTIVVHRPEAALLRELEALRKVAEYSEHRSAASGYPSCKTYETLRREDCDCGFREVEDALDEARKEK